MLGLINRIFAEKGRAFLLVILPGFPEQNSRLRGCAVCVRIDLVDFSEVTVCGIGVCI
jgi:hypothetical protein